MKNLIILIITLMSISCVSTKYKVDKTPNNFTKIEVGTKCTVYDKSDHKFFIDVTSVEKDSIIGNQK